MTDLLSASVSLGVKNKREISWKKISQPQTPLCLSLSSNLPSPVVWDLDWILYCADLSVHLPVPAAGTGEHPQSLPDVRGWASWRDFFTLPQLPAHSYVSRMCMGSCGSHIASVRYVSSCQGARIRSGKNSAFAVWEPWQPCHEHLYSLLRQLYVS